MPGDSEQHIVLCVRFIVYDRWLTSPVSTDWSISQLKAWLLSKCLHLPLPPDLADVQPRPPSALPPSSPITFAPNPRNRPISPLFFAQRPLSRSDSDPDLLAGQSDDDPDKRDEDKPDQLTYDYEEDDEWDSQDELLASVAKRRRRISPSKASGLSPSMASAAKYHVVRFTTGQILEDEFPISWYALQSFELLEIHPANLLINLPRHNILQYWQPYFSSKVRLLKSFSRDLVDLPGLDRSVPPSHATLRRSDKALRSRANWSDKWLIVRDGSLYLSKSPSAPPSHDFPIDRLQVLNGPEHLSEMDPAAGSSSSKIICAKFSTRPRQRPTATRTPSTKLPKQSSKTKVLSKPNRQDSNEASSSHTDVANRSSQPLRRSKSISFGPILSLGRHNPLPRSRSNIATGAPSLTVEEEEGHVASGEHSSEESDSAVYSSPIFAHQPQSSSEDELWWDLRPPVQRAPHIPSTSAPLPPADVHVDNAQWVVFDMLDENAFTSLLRILHRLARPNVHSSFLTTNSMFPSPTPPSSFFPPPAQPSSSPPSRLAQTSALGIFSGSEQLYHPQILTSESSRITMEVGRALPYPEWRISITRKAVSSGLGHLNASMVKWLCIATEGCATSCTSAATASSTSDQVLPPISSGGSEDDEEVAPSPGNQEQQPNLDDEDPVAALNSTLQAQDDQGPFSVHQELTMCEWVGWIGDLPRQSMAMMLERMPETTTGSTPATTTPTNTDNVRTVLPSLSSDISSLNKSISTKGNGQTINRYLKEPKAHVSSTSLNRPTKGASTSATSNIHRRPSITLAFSSSPSPPSPSSPASENTPIASRLAQGQVHSSRSFSSLFHPNSPPHRHSSNSSHARHQSPEPQAQRNPHPHSHLEPQARPLPQATTGRLSLASPVPSLPSLNLPRKSFDSPSTGSITFQRSYSSSTSGHSEDGFGGTVDSVPKGRVPRRSLSAGSMSMLSDWSPLRAKMMETTPTALAMDTQLIGSTARPNAASGTSPPISPASPSSTARTIRRVKSGSSLDQSDSPTPIAPSPANATLDSNAASGAGTPGRRKPLSLLKGFGSKGGGVYGTM